MGGHCVLCAGGDAFCVEVGVRGVVALCGWIEEEDEREGGVDGCLMFGKKVRA